MRPEGEDPRVLPATVTRKTDRPQALAEIAQVETTTTDAAGVMVAVMMGPGVGEMAPQVDPPEEDHPAEVMAPLTANARTVAAATVRAPLDGTARPTTWKTARVH